MINGNLSADGDTGWIQVYNGEGVHVSFKGSWGSGTVSFQERVNSQAQAILDTTGTPITHTNDFNRHINFTKHEVFRIVLTGATSPDLDYKIAGEVNPVV